MHTKLDKDQPDAICLPEGMKIPDPLGPDFEVPDSSEQCGIDGEIDELMARFRRKFRVPKAMIEVDFEMDFEVPDLSDMDAFEANMMRRSFHEGGNGPCPPRVTPAPKSLESGPHITPAQQEEIRRSEKKEKAQEANRNRERKLRRRGWIR